MSIEETKVLKFTILSYLISLMINSRHMYICIQAVPQKLRKTSGDTLQGLIIAMSGNVIVRRQLMLYWRVFKRKVKLPHSSGRQYTKTMGGYTYEQRACRYALTVWS